MRKEAYQRKTAPSTPSARRTNREREYGAACPEAQGEKPAETNRDCPNSSPDFSMQARISSRRARGATPSRTSRQERRICSRMNASGRSPVVQMPVQCFLLKRQAGSASAYLSRKAIAAPGSHSTAMQPTPPYRHKRTCGRRSCRRASSRRTGSAPRSAEARGSNRGTREQSITSGFPARSKRVRRPNRPRIVRPKASFRAAVVPQKDAAAEGCIGYGPLHRGTRGRPRSPPPRQR